MNFKLHFSVAVAVELLCQLAVQCAEDIAVLDNNACPDNSLFPETKRVLANGHPFPVIGGRINVQFRLYFFIPLKHCISVKSQRRSACSQIHIVLRKGNKCLVQGRLFRHFRNQAGKLFIKIRGRKKADQIIIYVICDKQDRIFLFCKKVKVLYRVTPGVAADSHDYIVTGKKDSKFGIPLDEDVFYPEVERAINSEYVDFLGLHFHVGSQLFDNSAHLQAMDIILDKVKEIKKRFGYVCTELNLGGGFGVKYTNEVRKPYSYFIDPMMEKIKAAYEEMGEPMPATVIEPGRSMVAEAGMNLYTIGSIKDIKGVRKYVSIDGGMTDNIRPALYGAVYEGLVANKADAPATDKVTICGKCCESGDILIRDYMIPEGVEAGDLFAIFSTGAYGYSMASNYNNNPIPAVVLVKDGESNLIVKHQSYEDIIQNNLIPDYLK